jgi:hypothetical protein
VLSTLVSAVTRAGLGDSLNSASNITVFAPYNDAFAKPALALADDLRLERAVPIPRHLDLDRADLGQHRLAAAAVA